MFLNASLSNGFIVLTFPLIGLYILDNCLLSPWLFRLSRKHTICALVCDWIPVVYHKRLEWFAILNYIIDFCSCSGSSCLSHSEPSTSRSSLITHLPLSMDPYIFTDLGSYTFLGTRFTLWFIGDGFIDPFLCLSHLSFDSWGRRLAHIFYVYRGLSFVLFGLQP